MMVVVVVLRMVMVIHNTVRVHSGKHRSDSVDFFSSWWTLSFHFFRSKEHGLVRFFLLASHASLASR
jgi:hypothetical protein